MAEISQIILNNTTYDIADTTARSGSTIDLTSIEEAISTNSSDISSLAERISTLETAIGEAGL